MRIWGTKEQEKFLGVHDDRLFNKLLSLDGTHLHVSNFPHPVLQAQSFGADFKMRVASIINAWHHQISDSSVCCM